MATRSTEAFKTSGSSFSENQEKIIEVRGAFLHRSPVLKSPKNKKLGLPEATSPEIL